MTIDFSNAVWASASAQRGRGNVTVSEKVDVCISHNHGSAKSKKEYLVVRIYAKKYAEVFGETERLSIGWLGNYLLIKAGDDYKLYNSVSNPEVRIPYDIVKACGRTPEKMFGGYLLKVDDAAGLAYVDLSVGARA